MDNTKFHKGNTMNQYSTTPMLAKVGESGKGAWPYFKATKMSLKGLATSPALYMTMQVTQPLLFTTV